MSFYVVSTATGALSFREGGVPPEGAEILDEGAFQERLAAAVAQAAAPPSPSTIPELVAYAATARYAAEIRGIEVGGERIATDERSQTLIGGAFSLATVDPTVTIQFKTASGFVALDATAIHIVGLSVARHVQAMFAREADVVARIASGEIVSAAQVDAAFAA